MSATPMLRSVMSVDLCGRSPSIALFRDAFHAVASAQLLGYLRRSLESGRVGPASSDRSRVATGRFRCAAMAVRQRVASRRHRSVPDAATLPSLSFREELHAIEAAIAGQGVALRDSGSPELANCALVLVSRVNLSGYGFSSTPAEHPKMDSIRRSSTGPESPIRGFDDSGDVGTHHHRCELREKPSPLVPLCWGRGDGSRLKAGTTWKEASFLIHLRAGLLRCRLRRGRRPSAASRPELRISSENSPLPAMRDSTSVPIMVVSAAMAFLRAALRGTSGI